MTDMTTEEATAALDAIAAKFDIVRHHLPTKSAERATWQIVLRRNGLTLDTTYSAGDAHLPAWKRLKGNKDTLHNAAILRHERMTGGDYHTGRKFYPPRASVLACLALDAEAINYGSFEQWAQEFGYDTDSRKAEEAYNACLRTGLFLRNTLTAEEFTALQDAARAW